MTGIQPTVGKYESDLAHSCLHCWHVVVSACRTLNVTGAELILVGLESTSSQGHSQRNNTWATWPFVAGSSVTSSQGSPSVDCSSTFKKKAKRPDQMCYSPVRDMLEQLCLKVKTQFKYARNLPCVRKSLFNNAYTQKPPPFR